MIKFKDEFKRLRKEKGITQGELAKILGVSRSTIGNYEQGIREPDFEMLEKISDYFNVSMSTLLDNQTDIDLYLKRKYEKIYELVQKYMKLNSGDQARIEERIDTLLEREVTQ